MLKSISGLVICTPFENTGLKTKQMGSLKLPDVGSGGTLIQLEVLALFEGVSKDSFIELKPCDSVYVKADSVQHAWAKGICTCEELVDGSGNQVRFILVPVEQIVLVRASE